MKRLITIALALLLTTLCMTGTADDVEMPSGIVVYDMGMRCYNAEEPDYAQAASYFLQAAEQGITQAMEMLADMYSEGRGVEKDANKAAFYYAQAAAQGADRSQYIIGTMFETGDLTIEDDSGTIQWDDGGTAAGAQMYTEDSAAAYYRMQYEAGMQEEENEAAAAAYYCLRYEENAQDPQPDYEQAAN